MRFAALIQKRLRRRAWYALGLVSWQKGWLTVGLPFAALMVLEAETGLNAGTSWLGALVFPLGVVAFLAPDYWVRSRNVRWIDELELPLDRESYANALDHASDYARLRVIVEGAALTPPTISGIVATVEVRSSGLVFESSTMEFRTKFTSGPHNLELHRWFVLLIDRVLRPLAREHEIARIVTEFVAVSHPLIPSARANAS